jgi:hypothetical protein
MQGGNTEADKTIEFGLDLAPLINQINNGQTAKFFLQVQENDPSGVSTGEIVNYALIDYSSGTPVTISCPSTNIAIANNTTTRLSVNHTFSVARPDITTTSLPPAYLYQMYNYQLTAAGGVVPYLWDAKLDYPETNSAATFPTVSNQQLTLTDNNSGYALVNLPFDFPFYKRSVNKLHVYADGYITFDDQPFTWPYLIDKMLLFKYTSIISPFMTDLCLYPSQSDGLWYQYDGPAVTLRWKASVYNMSGSSNLNFAVKLYKTGKIEFYYGTMNYPTSTSWTGGISSGDNKNYQFSLLNNAPSVTANTLDQMTACGYPAEMQITEDGLLTGTPVHAYQNSPITFQVTDNNNISDTKTLLFSTAGLLVNYSINSGGDSIIEFGETTYLNLIITNTGTQTIHNVNTWITETDPYISMIDSTQSVGDIGAGQNVTINNAFALSVSPVVPNNHQFTILLHLSSAEQNFERPLDMMAWAPTINVADITLQDGDNGRLDPGETTDMLVSFKNSGGATASDVIATISAIDPYLTINNGTGNIGTLKPDSTKSVMFNITVSGEAPFENLYKMNSALTANNGYTSNDTLFLFSGEIIEDFETGNFNKFPWYLGGNGLFYVDGLEHYEGNYCTRSGWIVDNEESTLNLNVQVLQNGKISFYRKVSCENDPNGTNYDYLGFYIDNIEMSRWDGNLNWAKVSFDVTPGYHTFKWVYHKDYSLSVGSDCAWVDFITFPPIAGAFPVISASPATFEKSLDMGQVSDTSFIVFNDGGGILDFSALVFDTTANKGSGETDNLTGSYISCSIQGFLPGQDFAWTFTVHNNSPDNEYINHIKMDFVPGILINTATNFSGGSLGDLQFQGTTGNGATLNWHGTSPGGMGVIKPGETAATIISGTVDESIFNDIFIVYSIRGDNTGTQPHAPSGYVKLNNYSLPNTWLTLSDNFGTLFGGQSDTVMVHFNAQNLPANSYSCNIVINDLFNNSVVIPVVMHVLDTTTISRINDPENKWNTTCYPNPFSNLTRIGYGIPCQTNMKVEVFDINGHKVKILVSTLQKAGNYYLTWDGTNDSGNPVASGVYYCRFQSGEKNESVKMILMR